MRHTALTARAFSIETGWPPPELLVTVNITSGIRSRPTRAIKSSSAATSMLPLNGCRAAGWRASGNRQIHGFGPHKFNVGARGVEVRVIGNHIALLAHHAEQNALGRATLVRGDHMLVAEDVLDGVAKMVEAPAAGIALVAQHDGRPLLRRHRAGARIGEQVDQHIVSRQQKQVVMRGPQQLFALLPRGPANRFDALDAKRLDDRSWSAWQIPLGVTSMLALFGRRNAVIGVTVREGRMGL